MQHASPRRRALLATALAFGFAVALARTASADPDLTTRKQAGITRPHAIDVELFGKGGLYGVGYREASIDRCTTCAAPARTPCVVPRAAGKPGAANADRGLHHRVHTPGRPRRLAHAFEPLCGGTRPAEATRRGLYAGRDGRP
jgi:hypothetical protein